jgi:hypothetical protein
MGSGTSRADDAAAAPRALGPADLLGVWEEGRGQPLIARALAILARALPSVDRERLADLPVGTRDALLLRLREMSFGPVAECLATCPACQATIEFPVTVRDLIVDEPPRLESVVDWQGARLRIRPATSRDQLSLAGLADPDRLAGALLQRCARLHETAGEAGTAVPLDAADFVSAEMARLDPGSDLRFALSCPTCHATWTDVFDAVSFLWREVEVEARRLLTDVHVLATAYGWSESEILNLSPARRRAYLQIAGDA